MTNFNITHVALYARVSTGKQAEKDLSIPDQIRQLEEYCKVKRWLVKKIYKENGASARDSKRPVFQEMIAEAKNDKHPFDAIVTLTTSRFFRDYIEAGLMRRELRKRGVEVIATQQNLAADDNPLGTVVTGFFELLDQYESEMNGFHTLRAMKENANRGFFNGSRPKFGFMAVKVDVTRTDKEKTQGSS